MRINRFFMAFFVAALLGAGGWIPAMAESVVQVGAYKDEQNARKAVADLLRSGQDAFSRHESAGPKGMLYRVYVRKGSPGVGTSATESVASLNAPVVAAPPRTSSPSSYSSVKEPAPTLDPPAGLAPATIPPPPGAGRLLASFIDPQKADLEALRLTNSGQPAMVQETMVLGQRWYRVYEKK